MAFFRGKVKVFNSGSNRPVDLASSCCFGMLPEADFLMKKNELSDAFVLEEISSSFGDTSNSKMIDEYQDYIKKSNKENDTKAVVLNLDLEDALVFNRRAHEGVEARKLSITMAAKTQYENFNSTLLPKEYDGSADDSYCEHAGNHFTDICYISISRLDPLYMLTNTLNQDKVAKKEKISAKDTAGFILGHELGHRVYHDKFVPAKEDNIEAHHKDEVFSDVFSSLMMLKHRCKPEFIEFMKNYRNNSFVKDVYKIFKYKGEEQKPDFDTVAKYNTSKAIDNVLSEYKKSPTSFMEMNNDEIANKAYEISSQTSLSSKELETLKDSFRIKRIDSEIVKALRMQHKFFKDNGYSRHENLQRFIKKDSEEQEKSDFSHKVEMGKKLFTKLSEKIKPDENYEQIFLESYTELTKETLQSISKTNHDEVRNEIKGLRSLLQEKENFKPALAFNESYKNISTPEFIKSLDGEKSLEMYPLVKIKYLQHLKPVLNDISLGSISEKTESHFKACMKYAKFSHEIAKKADKYVSDNDIDISFELKSGISEDKNNLAPKAMENIFKNRHALLKDESNDINIDLYRKAIQNKKR